MDVRLETEAFLAILEMIANGRLLLLNSAVLEYENNLNPFPARKEGVSLYLSFAGEFIRIDKSVEERALHLESAGFGSIDAVHLACAEKANADYFITSDKGLLKTARRHHGKVNIRTINPMSFVMEVLWNE